MSGIKGLKRRLDALTPPDDTGWLRNSRAYHRIFEESEEVQRDYHRMIMGILSEQEGVTLSGEELEKMFIEHHSTERLRGTKWERFVTDWSKPPWAQPPPCAGQR